LKLIQHLSFTPTLQETSGLDMSTVLPHYSFEDEEVDEPLDELPMHDYK
jgi:hypothetical protein